jgi:UDP-N-acetylmuramyl pentapeptide phosphotransferase/UDP-N-acetylglucosamine-1-phosphate transferase
MVFVSLILQYLGYINNSLLDRSETYLSIFTIASVGALGLFDDLLNIK